MTLSSLHAGIKEKVLGKIAVNGAEYLILAFAGGTAVYMGADELRDLVSKAGPKEICTSVAFNIDKEAIRRFGKGVLPDWTPFMWPNIQAVMQIEGIGQYFLPNKSLQYCGGQYLTGAYIPVINSGRKITIRFYSSHSEINYIFNNILSWKYLCRGHATVKVNMDGNKVDADIGFNTVIQLSDKKLQLFRDSYIGQVNLRCPNWPGNKWKADGNICDSNNKKIGQCELSSYGN